MLTMGGLGALIAAVRGVAPATNIPAALLTSYLVITSLITVRPPKVRMRWLDYGLMLVALGIGLTSLAFGLEALASPDGKGRDGMPPFPFFMFGAVGTAAALLDIRMIRSEGLRGASRLARHLWRMCFALFIAALSFFLGQSDEFPEAIRILPLLALPVLVVLVTMVYWLWRVLRGRSLRGTGADYRRQLHLHTEGAQSQ
jgi:peptidoglycan/LPS O-acetylase OafA/YrhL